MHLNLNIISLACPLSTAFILGKEEDNWRQERRQMKRGEINLENRKKPSENLLY